MAKATLDPTCATSLLPTAREAPIPAEEQAKPEVGQAPLEPGAIGRINAAPLSLAETAKARRKRRRGEPVSRIERFRFDSLTRTVVGLAADARPGCMILEGKDFPKTLEVSGARYDHLRNGFYIGSHATDRDIAGLFEALAPTYEATEINVAFNFAVYALLSELTPKRDAARVLDFGCGSGVGKNVLRERFPNAELLAFDLSPAMTALASRKGMTAVRENAGRLSLRDSSVDGAVSAFVLHLVRDSAWLVELARVLKPGGTATFNFYNPSDGWRDRVGAWFAEAGLSVIYEKTRAIDGGGVHMEMPFLVVQKDRRGARG